MSLLKSLAGETAIYGISNILGRMVHYILLTPYFTRIFDGADTDQYGIHTIMYGFSAILLVIFTFRLETAFFRFGSQTKYKGKAFGTAALPLVLFTAIMVLVVFLLATPIAGFLTQTADARYVQYFALIIGLDTLSALPFAKLRLENKAWWFVTIKIVNMIITVALTLLWLEAAPKMIEAGHSAFEAIYQSDKILDYIFLANLIASAITLIMLLPQYLRMKWDFDFELWKQMLVYAAPLVLVGLAGVINQLSDRYLLKELLPGTYEENMQATGIYAGCIKIAVLMSLFTTAFNYAAEPFFFKHADRKDAKKIYSQVAQAFILVASFAFLGICLYLDLLKYLVDEDYWSSLKIVPVVLVAYLLLGLYYNISVWYKVTNNTNYGAIIAITASILTIGLNFLLIPRIGVMGAAYTLLCAYFSMVLLGTIFGLKHYPIPYDWLAMMKYLGLAIVFVLLSNWVADFFEWSLLPKLIFNTILLISYAAILFKTERKFLANIIKET